MMDIKTSKTTADLNARVGDAERKLREAKDAHRASVERDILEAFAAIGIAPGDQVNVTETDWRGEVSVFDAFFAGARAPSWRGLEPMFKKVKADGTASSVQVQFDLRQSIVRKA
jgi:hypothetical protein